MPAADWFMKLASRDGQYRDTNIGDTYRHRAILLYRYIGSELALIRYIAYRYRIIVFSAYRRYKSIGDIFFFKGTKQQLIAASLGYAYREKY